MVVNGSLIDSLNCVYVEDLHIQKYSCAYSQIKRPDQADSSWILVNQTIVNWQEKRLKT